MREPSLRPERSASANSATSAGDKYFIPINPAVNLEGQQSTGQRQSGRSLTDGATFLDLRRYIWQIRRLEEDRAMFTLVVVAGLLLLLTLAGADLLVSGISPDELARMGLRQ